LQMPSKSTEEQNHVPPNAPIEVEPDEDIDRQNIRSMTLESRVELAIDRIMSRAEAMPVEEWTQYWRNELLLYGQEVAKSAAMSMEQVVLPTALTEDQRNVANHYLSKTGRILRGELRTGSFIVVAAIAIEEDGEILFLDESASH
jgi:hypothetical protein